MTSKTKDQIKAFFQTGDRPTEAQFIDMIDSYVDRSGPVGTFESVCSSFGTGPVIVNLGTPTIGTYAGLKTSMAITVATTADVASAIPGLSATTAQAVTGADSGVIMDPVLVKNAIVAQAFTSANFSSTAQANAGTDNTSIMTPVLVKNAISTLGGGGAGLTIIQSGSLSSTLVDIASIPTTYRELVLYVYGASNSVATRALIVRPNCGGGFGSDLTFYQQATGTSGSPTTTQVLGAAQLWTPINQTAVQSASCVVYFPAYQSGPIKTFHGQAISAAAAGDFGTGNTTNFSGRIVSTDAATPSTGALLGLRITWNDVSTGAFDSGTYALYGVN